jgi:hypothetical protein
MRLEKIELKSDLVNLFKDLEEAKRESKEVQSPHIEQSDIQNLLSDLGKISKETKVVEEKVYKEKIKEQVEIDINSIENLMKDLSSAYEQSKNEIVEEVVVTPEPEPIEVVDESAKIEEFEQLFSELTDVKPEVVEEIVNDIIVGFEEESDEDAIKVYAEQINNHTPLVKTQKVSDKNTIKNYAEQIKVKPQQNDVYQTDISTLENLTKEFTRFKARVMEQLGSLGGGGEVNLSKLDDVNISGQEDGDVLTFNKSTGKYELKSSTSTTSTGQLLSDEDGSNVVFDATDSSGTSEGDDILLEEGLNGGRDLDYNVLQSLTSDIIPAQTGTFNLGSSTNRFKNIFLESNTIDLGGSTISSDGTGQIIVSATGATLPIGSKTTEGKELLTVLPTTTEADETLPDFADQGALRAQSTRTIPLFTRAGDGTVDTSGTPNVNFTFANTLARRSVYTNSGFSFLLSNGTERSDLTAEIFEF